MSHYSARQLSGFLLSRTPVECHFFRVVSWEPTLPVQKASSAELRPQTPKDARAPASHLISQYKNATCHRINYPKQWSTRPNPSAASNQNIQVDNPDPIAQLLNCPGRQILFSSSSRFLPINHDADAETVNHTISRATELSGKSTHNDT
jgi:hypothetical protein